MNWTASQQHMIDNQVSYLILSVSQHFIFTRVSIMNESSLHTYDSVQNINSCQSSLEAVWMHSSFSHHKWAAYECQKYLAKNKSCLFHI